MEFVNNLFLLRQIGKEDGRESLNFRALVKIYKVFGRHYKKYWKALAVGYMSLFATVGVAVLVPWPLKLILDHVVLVKPLPRTLVFLNPLFALDSKLLLLVLSVSVLVIASLDAILSYVNQFWTSTTAERISADIRERVFAHLQRLSLSFHETARTGNLVYLLTSDVADVKSILIDLPGDLIKQTVTFGAYAVLMLAVDWRLGLIAFSAMPFVYLLSKYFGAGMRKALKKRRRQEGEVASIIAENVTAMALVQAYGRERAERDRFNAESKESLEAQLRALRLQRTYSRLCDFFITLSMAGVLYCGGRYALAGDILPGTLVVFVAYLREIYGSFEKVGELLLKMAKSQISGERLLELVENDMIVQDDPNAAPAPPFRGGIEFRNVSFAYKRGNTVLKNLNFVAAPGETVALVGHSGSGKSTLISLLLRFYDPQAGQILIDGQDIRKFTLKSLRDQVTILLQDANLFRQTVRDNIAFGKTGATKEEIVEAARLAEAHDFIMRMPQGYDAMMYEGGDNLSGGEKQRINIARAIIRSTPIVILDEPTTGLDARAEAKVNAAIRRLTQGKTTFIIAHRLSTIAHADKILLLEKGRLTHQGAHEQLLRESPHYRELHELQFGRRQKLAAASDENNGHLKPEQVAMTPRV